LSQEYPIGAKRILLQPQLARPSIRGGDSSAKAPNRHSGPPIRYDVPAQAPSSRYGSLIKTSPSGSNSSVQASQQGRPSVQTSPSQRTAARIMNNLLAFGPLRPPSAAAR